MEVNEGGEALRHLREFAGMTREQLSDETEGKVSEGTIVNYEDGRTAPTRSKVITLARVFGGEDGVWLLRKFGFIDDARLMAERIELRGGDQDGDATALLEVLQEAISRRLGRGSHADDE